MADNMTIPQPESLDQEVARLLPCHCAEHTKTISAPPGMIPTVWHTCGIEHRPAVTAALQSLRDRAERAEAENARLVQLRELVAQAFGALGPTGYFPSMGAPLSDAIRNMLADDCPHINKVVGTSFDRRAIQGEK